jgi:hypothetical protein
VACADLRGTSVTVGRLVDIETKASTASSAFCDAASGDLGVLVVAPSAGKGDGETETCVSGQCVGAELVDPSACEGTDGCGESALGAPQGDADAVGPDAAGSSTTT